jgi:hypothetical protein
MAYYVANTPLGAHIETMNIISLLIGIITLPLMLLALIPFLGWINYAVIPLAIFGAALGALSDSNAGRNLNLIVLVVGGVRLWMGGFIF